MGKFEEADGLLRPLVQGILRRGGRGLTTNWFKVTYSFLKNCSEWGRPEEGLEAARFSAKMVGDSLLQLGVLRLALHLEARKKNKEAKELIVAVKENVERLPEDAAILQIRARLTEWASGSEKALEYLRQNEARFRTEETGFSDSERARYFINCLIGELLLRAGRLKEARDQLHTMSLNDNVGEALFLLALSYAKDKQDDEAAQFLDRAGLVHRRWCRIAQLFELYPEIADSHKRLNREPCKPVPEVPQGNST